jgi:hypothetical protein
MFKELNEASVLRAGRARGEQDWIRCVSLSIERILIFTLRAMWRISMGFDLKVGQIAQGLCTFTSPKHKTGVQGWNSDSLKAEQCQKKKKKAKQCHRKMTFYASPHQPASLFSESAEVYSHLNLAHLLIFPYLHSMPDSADSWGEVSSRIRHR